MKNPSATFGFRIFSGGGVQDVPNVASKLFFLEGGSKGFFYIVPNLALEYFATKGGGSSSSVSTTPDNDGTKTQISRFASRPWRRARRKNARGIQKNVPLGSIPP